MQLAKRIERALPQLWSQTKKFTCACKSCMHRNLSSKEWKRPNNCFASAIAVAYETHTHIKIEIDMKYQKASFVIEIPLTCCTDVSLRSHKSSNGCAAAGSKSFVYCRNPDDVVKQHLHMQEWYRKRPSSRYGCANASITDIRLSYTRAITCHRRRKQRRWTKCIEIDCNDKCYVANSTQHHANATYRIKHQHLA